LASALAFAVLFFFLLPPGVGQLTQQILSPDRLATESNWLGNLAEGVIRLVILIGYIYLVGKIPDIRRVL
jgi:uncharacterized protein YqhQ